MSVDDECPACVGSCPRCGADLEKTVPDDVLVDDVLDHLDRDVALATQNGYYFKPTWVRHLDKVDTWYERMLQCPACGWDPNNPGDAMPEIPECYCWHYREWEDL